MRTTNRTGGLLMIVAGLLVLLVTAIWNDGDNRLLFLLLGAVFVGAGAATLAAGRKRS